MDRLPVELRLTIYSLTWEPRRVLVHPPPPHGYHLTQSYTHKFALVRIQSPPPVTLHINFESRQATLRSYIPLYQTPETTVYIHPTLDSIHLIPPRGSTPSAERAWVQQFLFAAAHITYMSADPLDDLIAPNPGPEAEVSSLGPDDASQLEPVDGGARQQTLPLTVDFYRRLDVKYGARRPVLWHRYCRTPGCEVPCWRGGPTCLPGLALVFVPLEDIPGAGDWRLHVFRPADGPPDDSWISRYFPFRPCQEVPGQPLTGEEGPLVS